MYRDEGKHAEMVVIGRRQLHTALKAEDISDRFLVIKRSVVEPSISYVYFLCF